MTQEGLIAFLIENQSLLFGQYQTKSGRESPYYLNTGVLLNVPYLLAVSKLYCDQIQKNRWNPTYIFGPAYKGVGLAIGTGVEMTSRGMSVRVGFDRKEKKDHGDIGIFVGPPITSADKVVIVDDVLTTGSSVERAKLLLEKTGATILGCVVLLDRKEKSMSEDATANIFLQRQGLNVVSVLSIEEVLASDAVGSHLRKKFDSIFCKKVNAYRQQFG